MDLRAKLRQLAKLDAGGAPVVSVYLNTRWADEQQRERTRVFLKNSLRDARRAPSGARLAAELDWLEGEGGRLVARSRFPDAEGVALFACDAVGLREVVPVRIPFPDAFVIADAPHLIPLAALLEETPATLVVFVDGESARFIPADPAGIGDEVRIEDEVEGQHRRGGWALLAQSRYRRHIEAQRGRHFEAVADTLAHLAEGHGAERIVLAGEEGTLAAFRKHLSEPILRRVVGAVAAARYEPAASLVERAVELLGRRQQEEATAALADVLTDAAKGGRAVAGLEETLTATLRGAVHRVYLLRGLHRPGRTCRSCGTLAVGTRGPCPACSSETKPTELVEALADRVIASDGTVETVDSHAGLEQVGGIAARLRYQAAAA